MKKRWIVGLCSLFMFFGMGVSSWASPQLEEIKAYLKTIPIMMDGEAVQFKDEKGKTVIPVSYQGTTYLPVRGVAELLDIDVHYDDANEVIYLGEVPENAIPDEDRDGSIELVSWSDRVENGKVIVSGSVQNKSSNGKTIGIVATGFDANDNAVEAKGKSGYVSSGSVRNFEITLDHAADIASVEADVTGYATDTKLLADGYYAEEGKMTVTGVVENGGDQGKTIGIVATGYSSDGKAIETKGSSGYVSSQSVRNFDVEFDAENIDYVEVKATGFANKAALLSDAGRQVDGKLEVTTVLENGTSNGRTIGIVVTGYTKDGKAVDTKGRSGYVSSGSVRNFSVTLDSAADIATFKTEVTVEE